jgi:hypothetical protein
MVVSDESIKIGADALFTMGDMNAIFFRGFLNLAIGFANLQQN